MTRAATVVGPLVMRRVAKNKQSTASMVPNCAQHVTTYDLRRDAAETVFVPDNAKYVFLSCTGSFYANFLGEEARVPNRTDTSGNSSCLNPNSRNIQGQESFSVAIDTKSEMMTAEWYT